MSAAMSAATIRLRGSLAPTWLACSRRASFEAQEAEERAGGEAVEVATEFGNRVHAAVTGHESEAPASVVFDEHTRTPKELHWQVIDAVRAAEEGLREFNIVRREWPLAARVAALGVEVLVTGTIDLVEEHEPANEITLFDLKTGRMDQRAAFAQMAVYTYLAAQNGMEVREAVILHVPRARLRPGSPYQSYELMRRPGPPLIQRAEAMIRMVALAAQSPVAVPGIHCGWCRHEDCIFHPTHDEELL